MAHRVHVMHVLGVAQLLWACQSVFAPKTSKELQHAVDEAVGKKSCGPRGWPPRPEWHSTKCTDEKKAALLKYGALSTWDVSRVTDMSRLFYDVGTYGNLSADLSKWDVSRVTDMSDMFSHDPDEDYTGHISIGHIGNWDVSKVTSMQWMFSGVMASWFGGNIFDGDLSKWDVSKVTNMQMMFMYANKFNGDISKWDISKVRRLSSMFQGASNFNGDLSKWNVSKVDTMEKMFFSAKKFNRDLSKWDVSHVNNFEGMFQVASSFSQDLRNWKVGSPAKTDCDRMFAYVPCSMCKYVPILQHGRQCLVKKDYDDKKQVLATELASQCQKSCGKSGVSAVDNATVLV